MDCVTPLFLISILLAPVKPKFPIVVVPDNVWVKVFVTGTTVVEVQLVPEPEPMPILVPNVEEIASKYTKSEAEIEIFPAENEADKPAVCSAEIRSPIVVEPLTEIVEVVPVVAVLSALETTLIVLLEFNPIVLNSVASVAVTVVVVINVMSISALFEIVKLEAAPVVEPVKLGNVSAGLIDKLLHTLLQTEAPRRDAINLIALPVE